MSDLRDKLRVIAGGRTDGASWSDGMDADVDVECYFEHAKDALVREGIEGDKAMEMAAALKEDQPIVTYRY